MSLAAVRFSSTRDLMNWIRSSLGQVRDDELAAATDAIQLDPASPPWGSDWAEYLRHVDLPATVLELELVRRPVQCECGAVTGQACTWLGPFDATVLVRYVPDAMRGDYEAPRILLIFGGEVARVSAGCARAIAYRPAAGGGSEPNPFVELLGARRES